MKKRRHTKIHEYASRFIALSSLRKSLMMMIIYTVICQSSLSHVMKDKEFDQV